MRMQQRGFTLTEILIVIAIVALLAALAIPSYQSSIQKSRRSDAQIALTQAATLQEQYYFANNSYADTAAALGINGQWLSPEGYYQVAIVAANSSQYSLSATAINSGSQWQDGSCRVFTLSSLGEKAAVDEQSQVSDCW